MEHSVNQYIEEVYYFDGDGSEEAIKDIQKLLTGELDIEDLRKDIKEGKIKDEATYGDEIYKSPQPEIP